MSEKEILALSEEFKEGHNDAVMVNLDGKNYYLVYGKIRYSGLDLSGTCKCGYRKCQYGPSAV